jgi:hypothetical protein
MTRRPSNNEKWARDYRAGQGRTNLQNSTQRHVSGGNRNNRNHDRGTCICMVMAAAGGLAVVAYHAVAVVLAIDPARFLGA